MYDKERVEDWLHFLASTNATVIFDNPCPDISRRISWLIDWGFTWHWVEQQYGK